jgi:hypothetical protein
MSMRHYVRENDDQTVIERDFDMRSDKIRRAIGCIACAMLVFLAAWCATAHWGS